MDRHEARERLRHHLDPGSGFLGRLRPFSGIEADQFHDVMACLWAVRAELTSSGAVDRELVSCLWSLVALATNWALNPGGMLQRTAVLSEGDRRVLWEWVDTISYTVMTLLDTGDETAAFRGYDPPEEYSHLWS